MANASIVVMLGDSVPAGRDCSNSLLERTPRHHPACAYPSRLVSALSASSSKLVRLHDLTVGGYSTAAMLPSLPSMLTGLDLPNERTLILADWSANDADQKPEVLTAALELFVRYTLTTFWWAALIIVETHVLLPANNTRSSTYRRVAHHYGLPYFRFGATIRSLA